MADLPSFADLAGLPDPPLDALALALAAEFREVDAAAAFARLDELGERLAGRLTATPPLPAAEAQACAALLGGEERFAGDAEDYDHPDNSMLDVVLERRRGLPIVLSVLYVEVARRAGVALAGFGLPGHFVVGHVGARPPVLLDPFAGGAPIEETPPEALLRPWRSTEIAMRMLNNLVAAHRRRGDLGGAIRAARMRLALPGEDEERTALRAELRSLQAMLN
jgi:regulator of sirC expression with transglutaminase-like and TPR domain